MAIWLIKYRYIFRYENAIFHARFIAYDINTFNNHNFQPLTTFQRKKKVEKIDPSLIPRSLPRMDGTFPTPYSITDVEPPLTANPFFQPMVLKESTPSDKAAREIPFRPFPGFHVKGVKGVNLDGGLEATKRIPPRRFDACRGYNRIPPPPPLLIAHPLGLLLINYPRKPRTLILADATRRAKVARDS